MTTAAEDHEDVFNQRLTSPFQGKATFASLARIVGKYANELEDVFADILVARTLGSSTGAQLDLIGNLVGQLRGTADDSTFRLYIAARIKVNRSNGTIDELSTIAKVITGALTAYVQEWLPNVIEVHVLSVAVSDLVRQVLLDMLYDAKAGGVQLQVHVNAYPPAQAFAFAGGTGAGFGVGHLSSLRVR